MAASGNSRRNVVCTVAILTIQCSKGQAVLAPNAEALVDLYIFHPIRDQYFVVVAVEPKVID